MTDIPDPRTSVPSRLGVRGRFHDGELALELHRTPGTLHHGSFRASVVLYVIDAVAGITVDDDPDVWTFTTDLSVRMRPVPAPDCIIGRCQVVRRGGRSSTCTVELTSDDGELVGSGTVGFAKVPRRDGDPPKPSVALADAPAMFAQTGTLGGPLRDEAGIEVIDAHDGVVQLEVRPNLCNPAGTLQGAMVALLAEAAAEELVAARTSAPALVTELDVRYLAKATEGIVRTRSRLIGTAPDAPIEVELIPKATGTPTTHVYARAVTVG